MNALLRVLVVGCGQMGSAHARAYESLPSQCRIVGLVSRGRTTRAKLNAELGGGFAEYGDIDTAIRGARPDIVCISTYPETHAEFALKALAAGCHVFLEKPVATNLRDADAVLQAARKTRRKLVVGYILQVHPVWQEFVRAADSLGRPLVMRMNLNQQSSGEAWRVHEQLLRSASPLVDCGVHYVEVMCRMTRSRPVRVSAIAANLRGAPGKAKPNYGQLQVAFADGSVGWYEAGWGPMMSETAFFVKDVVGPKGSVSLLPSTAANRGRSADVGGHTEADSMLLHSAQPRGDGAPAPPDRWIEFPDVPHHHALCRLEQEFFLKAIREDIDLEPHWQSARTSLEIVLAADESAMTGRTIELSSSRRPASARAKRPRRARSRRGR